MIYFQAMTLSKNPFLSLVIIFPIICIRIHKAYKKKQLHFLVWEN
eukprot:UN08987